MNLCVCVINLLKEYSQRGVIFILLNIFTPAGVFATTVLTDTHTQRTQYIPDNLQPPYQTILERMSSMHKCANDFTVVRTKSYLDPFINVIAIFCIRHTFYSQTNFFRS